MEYCAKITTHRDTVSHFRMRAHGTDSAMRKIEILCYSMKIEWKEIEIKNPAFRLTRAEDEAKLVTFSKDGKSLTSGKLEFRI